MFFLLHEPKTLTRPNRPFVLGGHRASAFPLAVSLPDEPTAQWVYDMLSSEFNGYIDRLFLPDRVAARVKDSSAVYEVGSYLQQSCGLDEFYSVVFGHRIGVYVN